MSTASPAQAAPFLSSASANVGVVGEVPTSSGLTHFAESTFYRNYPQILFGVAGFFGLFGVAMMMAIGGPAWLFLLFVPVFAIWGMNRRSKQVHVDCVADGASVTLRTAVGKTPMQPLSLSWARIQQTQCGIMGVTYSDPNDISNNSTKEYLTFQMVAPGQGEILLDATRVKNLPGLIALANQRTPHLGYVWLPAKEAKGRNVLEKTRKYWRVSR